MSVVPELTPHPTDVPTNYPVGSQMVGQDNSLWEVRKDLKGVKWWEKLNNNYKFQVGDLVKIVTSGLGCNPDTVGELVTITGQGHYTSKEQGYIIKETHLSTNTKSGFFGGLIGESSFELVTKAADILQQTTYKTVSQKSTVMKAKSVKKTAQEVRAIETSMINKEEVFKMLALSESTGLPLLLVGQPGVGKTKTVIEYAKAWLNKDGNMSAKDFAQKIYILETDEGTKASEIKGIPDLSVLFTQNKYELSTPIAEAEIVIINEVDKASSAIRNAMLGVMNEKFLFNGKHKIPCKWKIFVATCNEIPKDEANSPFWDRFMLKHTVNRVSAGEISKYYSKGGREYKEKFNISIPNKAEINSFEIPTNKLEKYLEVGYNSSSDRTLTFVPSLTKAVSYIWNVSVDKALVKTAQIMISQTAGSELQNKLMSPEVKAVMSKVEMLHSYSNNEQLELAVAELEALINTYTSRGLMDEGQVEEIELSMQYILASHPARKDYQSAEEFEGMIDQADEIPASMSSF
jgi:MoxR-like ATPase